MSDEVLEEFRAAIKRSHEEALAIERPLWERMRGEPGSLDGVMRDALRAHLRHLMSDISEDYYCAGWLGGLEFTLWKAATEGPISFGAGVIPAATCLQLAQLADLCGGWWRWSDEAVDEVFVPMEEWLAMYREHREQETRRVVLRLLRERFGELPPEIVKRVEAESADWCEELAVRMLAATSLEELGP
jgi:hypothetical protein